MVDQSLIRWRSAIQPILFVIALQFLSGCAAWTTTDTKYEIAFQAVNLADAYTTSRIRHTDDVFEAHPITRSLIGSQPAERDTALLFITYAVSHYIIARALPEKWRRFYQVSTTAYSASLVIANCDRGLCK